jgi:hypothetical protein
MEFVCLLKISDCVVFTGSIVIGSGGKLRDVKCPCLRLTAASYAVSKTFPAVTEPHEPSRNHRLISVDTTLERYN